MPLHYGVQEVKPERGLMTSTGNNIAPAASRCCRTMKWKGKNDLLHQIAWPSLSTYGTPKTYWMHIYFWLVISYKEPGAIKEIESRENVISSWACTNPQQGNAAIYHTTWSQIPSSRIHCCCMRLLSLEIDLFRKTVGGFPRNSLYRVIGGLLREFYVLWALRVVGTFFHCIFHSVAVTIRNDTRRCTEP